jgi:hypothetical protein
MKEKFGKALNLIILFAFVLCLKVSTQANNQKEYFYEKIVINELISLLDEEDKIIAVCRSTSKIPKGWVVIGQGNVEGCRNNSIAQPMYNAWFIKKPAKEEFVCQNSPLPDDYVVVKEAKIADCPGGSSLIENKNGWLIKLIE